MENPAKKALLVWCILVLSSGPAQGRSLRDLQRRHRAVWEMGGVCRNAATEVVRYARAEGHDAFFVAWRYLKWFDGEHTRYKWHVVPVVKVGSSWHEIDSIRQKLPVLGGRRELLIHPMQFWVDENKRKGYTFVDRRDPEGSRDPPSRHQALGGITQAGEDSGSSASVVGAGKEDRPDPVLPR